MKWIEYKNHIKQFTSFDNKIKNDYFGAIIKSHIDGKKNILIDILVQSKTPYIFLYLPNAVITSSDIKEKQIGLRKKWKKDTQVNELKIQTKGKDIEINELNTQVIELKMQINSLNDIIKEQNKKYQELQTQMNKILSNYNLLNENKNNGS